MSILDYLSAMLLRWAFRKDLKPQPESQEVTLGDAPAGHVNWEMCTRCGDLTFSFANYRVRQDTPSVKKCQADCDYVTISEEQYLSSSGKSEEEMLEYLMRHINLFDPMKNKKEWKLLREEVEKRMGLGTPVTEDLPLFERQNTTSIDHAIALLRDNAIASVPTITKIRVEFEYAALAGHWGCTGFREGTLLEICEALRKNLERDATFSSFNDFSVDVIPNVYSAEVGSHFHRRPGDRYGTVTVYRIWRTTDLFFFCGSKDTIL